MPKTETAVGQGSSKRVEGTGVGAGQFSVVRKTFARISPNCERFLLEFFPTVPKREKFSGNFLFEYFLPHRSWRLFWNDLQRHFFKSNNIGRHFCPYFQEICPDFMGFCEHFQWFCSYFYRFCPDFWRSCQDLWQMKTFEGALAPPASPPLTPLVEDNEIFKKFLFIYTAYIYI